MVIRKLYKIESAHIVRGAISQRCSHSFHGHGGKIEVFFKSSHLDNAGMVYDFGAMKNTVGSFIDMFDHSIHLYNQEAPDVKTFFTTHNDRYVILPFNPTAENYALFFKNAINDILHNSVFTNGEGQVYCSGVRYHETDTGYAESDEQDSFSFSIKDVVFSPKTVEEASPVIRTFLETLGG